MRYRAWVLSSVMFLAAMGSFFCARAGAASVHAFDSGMNCNGVWWLPDTGQTASYTATSGEDHDYQPASVQPRYTVLNPVGISSVTVDNVTGLMWLTNPRTDAGLPYCTYTWQGGITACEGLSYAGYTDWRLPNARELLSVVDYGKTTGYSADSTAFPGMYASCYWTSTAVPQFLSGAYTVCFAGGTTGNDVKTHVGYCLQCVRGGQ